RHTRFSRDWSSDVCSSDLDFTALLQKVYRDFGFTEVLYKVATRPDKRIGSDEIWDKAETALMESLRRTGCEFEISPGEGAFYGRSEERRVGKEGRCR